MTDIFDVEDWDKGWAQATLTPQVLRVWRAERDDERLSQHHRIAQALALADASPGAFRQRFDDLCSAPFDEVQTAFVATMLRSPALQERRNQLIGADPATPASGVIVHRFTGPLSDRRELKDRDAMRQRLAQPLDLAGPETLDAVDETFAQALDLAPWMRAPIEALWRAARGHVAAGRGFSLDPVLLLGGAGVGKTHLVQTLAELTRIPFRRLEAGVMTAAFEIGGAEVTWSSGNPGAAVRLIAESRVANPMILIDEIDKFSGKAGSGGDPRAALLPLLQRSTAATFACPYLQAPIDLSRVSWILCANTLDGLSRPLLDRLAVFEVAAPRGPDLEALARKTFADLDLPPGQLRHLCAAVAEGRLSLRGLTRLADSLRSFDDRPHLH